jgi:hypothetical protein
LGASIVICANARQWGVFRSTIGRIEQLTVNVMDRVEAYSMIRHRTAETCASLPSPFGSYPRVR